MGPELTEGAVIAGYRLERPLGQGGMGVVWAASGPDGQPVALKLMRNKDRDPKVVRRFIREARAAAAIEHPNVVRVLDVLELDRGDPAIVMERLDGEPLARRLIEGPPLSIEQAAGVLLPAISAVGAAHAAGIVHRDLKPENVFLTREPDGARGVKVLDFGIAKLTADAEDGRGDGATTTGALLGTPAYMSPEQVFGEKDVDYRTDVWSLGMMLYECVSGVLPTQAENVGQILKLILTKQDWHFDEAAPDAPEDVKELVGRMLSKDPAKRPELREVAEVLARHASVEFPDFGAPAAPRAGGDTPAEARSPSRNEVAFASTVRHDSPDARAARAQSEPSRPRARAWAMAAVVLLAAGASIWLFTRERPAHSLQTAQAPGPAATDTRARSAPAVPEPAREPRPIAPTPPDRSAKPRPTPRRAAISPKAPVEASSAPTPPPAPKPSTSSLSGAIQSKPPF